MATKFVSRICNASPDDIVYINAINLSVRDVNNLRRFIVEGKLEPVFDEVKKCVKPAAIPDVMSGFTICPQMFYLVKEV